MHGTKIVIKLFLSLLTLCNLFYFDNV